MVAGFDVAAEQFFRERIFKKTFDSAAHAFRLMTPVRGHRMAKATIETACWDLEAKRAAKSAYELAGLSAPQPLTTALYDLARHA